MLLKLLHLGSSYYASLPKNIYKLKNLEKFIMSFKDYDTFSEEIENLITKLREAKEKPNAKKDDFDEIRKICSVWYTQPCTCNFERKR